MRQRTTLLLVGLLFVFLALSLLASAALAATCEEVQQLTLTVTWDEPEGLVGNDWARCAEQWWGPRWASNGCVHPTDHIYALTVVNELVPSLFEVESSWRSGCTVIWQARCKTMIRDANGRPSDWSAIAPGSRMLEVLAYLAELRTLNCVTSITQAMKIFDGKAVDPEPQKTAAMYALWTGSPPPAAAPPVVPTPSPAPNPTPSPTPAPIACPAGQQCRSPCPVVATTPCPSRPACAACPPAFALPAACQPIAALRKSADVIARNAFTSQQRRQRVANCIKALE